jgi:hypothetical protein
MNPLFRAWALTAAVVAALLALRGAWLAALAVFLLSPAPALALARGPGDAVRSSLSWLAGFLVAIVALLALVIVVVSFGGLPQVHEWRALLRA